MSLLRKLGRLIPQKKHESNEAPLSEMVLDSGIAVELSQRQEPLIMGTEEEEQVDFSDYSNGYQTYTIDRYRGVGPDSEASTENESAFLPVVKSFGLQAPEHSSSSALKTEPKVRKRRGAENHLPTLGQVPYSGNSACPKSESAQTEQAPEGWGKTASVPPNWGSGPDLSANWGESIEVHPKWGDSIEVRPNWGQGRREIRASWVSG